MRFRATLVFLVVGLSLSAWSQLTYTVPVVDMSETGSPLAISGTASFSENVAGNSVVASSEFRVMARNISGKEIILLVAYFDESGPHGGGTRHILQFDNSFRTRIAPEQSFVLARSDPGNRTWSCCINPLEAADEPTAEVRVQFVSFGDGSTFGDKATAKDILAIQATVLDRLRALDKPLSDEEFLHSLAQKIEPLAADHFFDALRRTQKEKGTAAARSRAHRELASAEKRLAPFRTVEAAKE
jgi:hypothetical protein